MFSSIQSIALQGITGIIVNVETDVRQGLPNFSMTGCGSSQVKEAGERVSSAMANSGFKSEPCKILVNLSPAEVKKEGTGFDLPIALALLSEKLPYDKELLKETIFAGELGLDGSVRKIRGILPLAEAAAAAGMKHFVIPADNASEVSFTNNIETIPVKTLNDAVGFCTGARVEMPETAVPRISQDHNSDVPDFSEIQGQANVKRALMVAAAGMHNILMIGPAGSGKTMLAKSLPGIMPPMDEAERNETVNIYSVAGKFDQCPAVFGIRPMRCPSSTISSKHLIGDAAGIPGEISLAHRGVLFLDELPEFDRKVTDSLRTPLEEGCVRLSGRSSEDVFPSEVLLAAAMNPCRCGFYPDRRLCRCNENDVRKYLDKISRPMIDRFDIFSEAGRISVKDMMENGSGESSADVKKRVILARERQKERLSPLSVHFNAQIPGKVTLEVCRLSPDARELLLSAYDRLCLSLRGYHRMIRVARTIADIEEHDDITTGDMAEAIHYREIAARFWG